MRVFKSFRSVIVCSVIISLFCASTGLLLAILEGTPVGSTIVAADIAVFFIFSIISMVARRGEK
jgi:zinc transport system permease protein